MELPTQLWLFHQIVLRMVQLLMRNFLDYILKKYRVEVNNIESNEEQVESQEVVCVADIDWAEELLANTKQKN
jgi:hypothetical protein